MPKKKKRPITKVPAQNSVADLLVGHRPTGQLALQDEALFRAFQSNLLSLISHELRTPLTGVLNALNALEASDEAGPREDAGPLSQSELILMAKRNAQRLQQALVTVLDLAAIESGTFHAHLREVELSRLVRKRIELDRPWLKDCGIASTIHSAADVPVLADPQKLSRAIDLILEVISGRAESRPGVSIEVLPSRLAFSFTLKPEADASWVAAWSQALAGFEGGVMAPGSAFAGVLQSETGFLTRSEEGLGSELQLIHQIMRLHRGKLLQTRNRNRITLTLEFPELSSEEALRAVLSSRAYEVTNELGSVALALVNVPDGLVAVEFCDAIKRNLFRATDAVYPVPQRRQVALVLDDCKVGDAPRVMKRIEKAIGMMLDSGVAHCPSDGLDPAKLLDIANRRLSGSSAGDSG